MRALSNNSHTLHHFAARRGRKITCVFSGWCAWGGCRFAFPRRWTGPQPSACGMRVDDLKCSSSSRVNYGLALVLEPFPFRIFRRAAASLGPQAFCAWNSSRAPNALKVSEILFPHIRCCFSLSSAWSRFNLLMCARWAPFLPRRRARWKDTTRIFIITHGRKKTRPSLPMYIKWVQKKSGRRTDDLMSSFSITLLIFCS